MRFVDENIELFAVACDFGLQKGVKLVRVSVCCVFFIVQVKADDIFILYADGQKIIVIEIKKQVAFAAASDSRDDFYHSVFSAVDEPFKIEFALDGFHGITPYFIKTAQKQF